MARYRKLPVEIEAVQFGDSTYYEYAYEWAVKNSGDRSVIISHQEDNEHILVETLEGTMRVNYGDWIIKGVAGELYPCKDEIFQQTYKKVD